VTVTSGQLTVTLTNNANGTVIADAVRIEQATNVSSQPQIINGSAESADVFSQASAIANRRPVESGSDLVLRQSALPTYRPSGPLGDTMRIGRFPALTDRAITYRPSGPSTQPATSLGRSLLVAESFDGIHLGGAVGGVEAEDDADDDGDAEGQR
jgi:hypothetical protein